MEIESLKEMAVIVISSMIPITIMSLPVIKERINSNKYIKKNKRINKKEVKPIGRSNRKR